jgi:Amt family ammonium transporter
MAMLVTQLATAMAAITWMFIEWIKTGRPTAVGIATGAVAGLVAITPASGTAGPMGALLIGFCSSTVCFFSATSLKHKLGYDDSLDVFGVHGIGGIVGAVLTGCALRPHLGGSYTDIPGIGFQVFAQIKSVIVTIAWSGVVSVITLFIIDKTIGLRVNDEEEMMGLDQACHGESGYNS